MPLEVHLGVVAVVFGTVGDGGFACAAARSGRRRPRGLAGDGRRGRGAGSHPRRAAVLPLAALGVLGVFGAFVEDAGASWSALYLRNELAAGAATAGLGFVALQVGDDGRAAHRRPGGRPVRPAARGAGRWRAHRRRHGGALAFPSITTTLIGFALAGLGVATLIPAVYHAADELPGLSSGSGLTVINWLLRVGFLVSPLLIGVLADAASLRVALLTVVLAGVGIVAFGGALRTSVAPVAA